MNPGGYGHMRVLLGPAFAAMIAVLVLLGPGKADADEPYYFVQVTCAPELQYFSIQSLMISNTFGQWTGRHFRELQEVPEPEREDKRVERFRTDLEQLTRLYGYYQVDQVAQKPLSCVLKPDLKIEVAGETTPPSNGVCAGTGSGRIFLRINDQSVDQLWVYGGSCDHSAFRTEIDRYSYSSCQTTFAGDAPVSSVNKAGAKGQVPTYCQSWPLSNVGVKRPE